MWLVLGKLRVWDCLQVNICFVAGCCPNRLNLNGTQVHSMYRLITRMLSTCVLWCRNLYSPHRRAYKEAPQILLCRWETSEREIFHFLLGQTWGIPRRNYFKNLSLELDLYPPVNRTHHYQANKSVTRSDRAHHNTPLLTLPRWQCKTPFLMSP